VGVAGGSASGKTTICNNIKNELKLNTDFKVTIISLDSFYKSLDKSKHNPVDYNFDHPDALDFDYAFNVMQKLLKGEKTQVPHYCFVKHARL
jgi:uridine kinase